MPKKSVGPKTRVRSIRLPVDLDNQIEAEARACGKSYSSVIIDTLKNKKFSGRNALGLQFQRLKILHNSREILLEECPDAIERQARYQEILDDLYEKFCSVRFEEQAEGADCDGRQQNHPE